MRKRMARVGSWGTIIMRAGLVALALTGLSSEVSAAGGGALDGRAIGGGAIGGGAIGGALGGGALGGRAIGGGALGGGAIGGGALGGEVVALVLHAPGYEGQRGHAPGAAGRGQGALERCIPSQVAEDYWFSHADPEAVTLWFDTVDEAENYADPEGRSVYWLVRVARTLKSESFVAGINDLWAVEFYVVRGSQCEPVVTAEH